MLQLPIFNASLASVEDIALGAYVNVTLTVLWVIGLTADSENLGTVTGAEGSIGHVRSTGIGYIKIEL